MSGSGFPSQPGSNERIRYQKHPVFDSQKLLAQETQDTTKLPGETGEAKETRAEETEEVKEIRAKEEEKAGKVEILKT